jgi:hypothetical protein
MSGQRGQGHVGRGQAGDVMHVHVLGGICVLLGDKVGRGAVCCCVAKLFGCSQMASKVTAVQVDICTAMHAVRTQNQLHLWFRLQLPTAVLS